MDSRESKTWLMLSKSTSHSNFELILFLFRALYGIDIDLENAFFSFLVSSNSATVSYSR